MSIVSALCDSYIKEQMDDGLHKAADIYMIALIKSGSTGVFDALTTNYSQLGADELANGNGYTTGGLILNGRIVTSGVGAELGLVFIDWSDALWYGANFTAAGALIYNSSQGNAALAVISFGADYTVSGGGTFSLPLDRPIRAGVNRAVF